mmetsp:Transcript_65776/g.183219  ORF Transcript_65776/g.183219 Transcript_65776/m.183219 type:complete len:298 (-) Transcript_65776:8-901(-)
MDLELAVATAQTYGVCAPLQACLGMTLAAFSGLRAFAPLFLLSLYMLQNPGQVQLACGWVDSHWFLMLLGMFVVFEVLMDKIPCVDHVLHGALLVISPLAGASAVHVCGGYCDPDIEQVAVIYGALLAFVVHLARGSARVASTASTGGAANCCFSLAEDIALVGLMYFVLTAAVAAVFAAAAAVVAGPIVMCLLCWSHCCGCCADKRRRTEGVQPILAGHSLPPGQQHFVHGGFAAPLLPPQGAHAATINHQPMVIGHVAPGPYSNAMLEQALGQVQAFHAHMASAPPRRDGHAEPY